MSVHLIYYQQGHKMMEAVTTEEAYRRYRDSQAQQRWVETIRHPKPETDVSAAKRKLVQFNYSCLPTEDGCLKGAKRLSKSVGMDIDHLSVDEVNLVAATAIEKKDELGLLMLERSARGGGLHVVFRRHPEMDQETNLRWASDLLGVEYDAGAKDITRVFFATTSEDLLYLHEDLFDNAECEASTGSATATKAATKTATEAATTAPEATQKADRTNRYPMASVASEAASTASETVSETTGQNDGEAKTSDNQGEKTDKEASEAEAPLCYEGIPYDRIIKKWWDFYNEGKTPSKSNRNTLTFELAVNLRNICDSDPQLLNRIIPCYDEFPEAEKMACIRSALGEKNTQMPKRVKDVLTAVRQDMRAEAREEAEEEEALLQDDLYYYDALPKMPQGVRESIDAVGPYLADRLANTGGKHAFSFTPEADTVAQKWRTAMCDFSVMLRQAYDGTPYNREAKSADAVNVHIEKLLWNVVMCGTPDALYRVITNYTDGFQSRVAVARTPDNTFSALAESPYRLTEQHKAKIQQVAHLLPLMKGDVELPKLEKRGRDWLERIRIETLENDDKTKARQRFRTCPTAMRMMTCLMLCRVAELLIQRHGFQGAEKQLKAHPTLWQELLQRQQTPQMLATFDVLADYMIDNAIYFFRERIEEAFRATTYAPSDAPRTQKGSNDTIYRKLAGQFTTEEAYGATVSVRGFDVQRGRVFTMLSRWERQGMVERIEKGVYKKTYR